MIETGCLGDRIRNHWLSLGLNIRAGVPRERLVNFEKQHAVLLTPDLRNYFLAVDGMELADSDREWNRFWQLDELEFVADGFPEQSANVPDPSRCLMFADHSIGAHTYAAQLSANSANADAVYVLGFEGEPVAASFSSFVELCISGESLKAIGRKSGRINEAFNSALLSGEVEKMERFVKANESVLFAAQVEALEAAIRLTRRGDA